MELLSPRCQPLLNPCSWLPSLMRALHMLGLLHVVRAATVSSTTWWKLESAVSTIRALKQRTGPRPLDLLEDMYDDKSGLCSEGTWHNAWLGSSHVLAARQLRAADDDCARADAHLASARMLGNSLFEMSYDGSGFRKRSASGIWQSATDAAPSIEAAGENPTFYHPSDEHRCVSTAAVLIFYSLLAEEARGTEEEEASLARCTEVAKSFTADFFDPKACRFRRSNAADETSADETYWRAADQAMGCLACLRMAKLGLETAASRAMASCALDSLLLDFGYSLYENAACHAMTWTCGMACTLDSLFVGFGCSLYADGEHATWHLPVCRTYACAHACMQVRNGQRAAWHVPWTCRCA